MPGLKTRNRHLNNDPIGYHATGTHIAPLAKLNMPTGLDGRDSKKTKMSEELSTLEVSCTTIQ